MQKEADIIFAKKQAKKTTQAYKDWMRQHQWTVFGTLKFHDGQSMNKYVAEKLLSRFWNNMDRAYYGNLARHKNIRISRATYLQYGESAQSTNLHYHFLANPLYPEHFCNLAPTVWGSIDNRCFQRDSHVQIIIDQEAVTAYICKEVLLDGWRVDNESFCEKYTHFEFLNNHIDKSHLKSVMERRNALSSTSLN